MRRLRLVILLSLAVLPSGPARAGEAPPPVESDAVRTGRFADDLYVAGRTVRVDGRVSGDVVAAGGDVTVGRAVSGDVLVAGGRVTTGGEVGDDVRAAGGHLILGGRIAGDLVAAGGRVAVPTGTTVAGRTRIAGGEVDLAGRYGRSVEVYGRHVRLAGEVPGDVEVAAERLEVLPEARIGGTLYHATRTPPRIAPEATVGAVVALDPATDWRAEALSRLDAWRDYGGRARGVAGWTAFLALWPALLATGLVVLALAPAPVTAAARTVGSDPGKSLGLGFVTVVVVPALVLVLLVTVLGVWLGLVLLALYPVALLAGLVVGVAWLGDLVARAVGGPDPTRLALALGFAAAVVVVALATLIPFVGGFVLPAAVLAGLGAIALALARAVRRRPASAA